MLYKDRANRKSDQQNLGTIHSSNLCAKKINDDIFEESGYATRRGVQRGHLGTPHVAHMKFALLTFVTSVRVILPSACFGLVASLQQNQPRQQTELSGITNSFGKHKRLGRLEEETATASWERNNFERLEDNFDSRHIASMKKSAPDKMVGQLFKGLAICYAARSVHGFDPLSQERRLH